MCPSASETRGEQKLVEIYSTTPIFFLNPVEPYFITQNFGSPHAGNRGRESMALLTGMFSQKLAVRRKHK